jgi:hypothetical protein
VENPAALRDPGPIPAPLWASGIPSVKGWQGWVIPPKSLQLAEGGF